MPSAPCLRCTQATEQAACVRDIGSSLTTRSSFEGKVMNSVIKLRSPWFSSHPRVPMHGKRDANQPRGYLGKVCLSVCESPWVLTDGFVVAIACGRLCGACVLRAMPSAEVFRSMERGNHAACIFFGQEGLRTRGWTGGLLSCTHTCNSAPSKELSSYTTYVGFIGVKF